MAGKERSPNYPALSLEAAIQAIRKIYDKERRTAVATDLIGSAMGHPKLSGAALTKIAALRQYGLLEKAGSGKSKVSDDAMTVLLRKPEDPEYLTAIRKIALAPALFADLYHNNAGASDDSIRYNLVKERGFLEEGADRVIKAFRSTISFAKLTDADYNQERETLEEQPEEDESVGESWRMPREPSRQAPYRDTRGEGPPERNMAFNWLLPGGVNAQLAFQGAPTPKAIDRLIDYLKFMKDDIPGPDLASERPLEEQDAS